MTEQLRTQPTPEQPKRHIETLPLDSPELHFLYNYLDFAVVSDASSQDEAFRKLQKDYGEENVRKSLAMIDGKHVANPHLFGIYVNAIRWAELHPPQETAEQPSTGA